MIKITMAAVSGAFALVACFALALAQNKPANVQCKSTETQAECHARLKCKADEELEACQKRLLKCIPGEALVDCEKRAASAKQGNASQQTDGNNQSRDDAAASNRRDRDQDRGDRGDRGDRDKGRADDGDRDDGSRSRRRRGGGGGRGGGGRSGGGGFEANKKFGLGLEIGEPTGLNGKYFLSDSRALDFGIGWIYHHYYYGDGIHIYADYLFHPVTLVSASAFELPLYVGPGLRFWDFDYCDRQVCYGGSALGIRVPVGVSFDFNNVPLDIFIQLVPVVDFIRGDYYDRFRDRTHFGIDLSAGIRYWFK